MFVNIIKSYRDVVAVCDSDLLGKRFEEPFDAGNGEVVRQLDVKENFYKGAEGKEVSESELMEIMQSFKREDATFNIVGKNSINAAVRAGILAEESIDKINEIPFALILF